MAKKAKTPPAPPPSLDVEDATILSAKHQRAIEALLVEPTLARAAEVVGVHRQWITRQLSQNQTFRIAYREARLQALQHGIDQVTRYTPLAVQTLAKITADEKAPYATRVTAATSLLNFGRQVREVEEGATAEERRQMEYTRASVREGEATVERIVLLAEEFGRLKDLPPNLQEYAKELRKERGST